MGEFLSSSAEDLNEEAVEHEWQASDNSAEDVPLDVSDAMTEARRKRAAAEAQNEIYRRRDKALLEVVQAYKEHPTMPARTKRFYDPVDPETLSLNSRRRFFQEMSQYRLLSSADESELFAALNAGVRLYEERGGVIANDYDDEEVFLEAAAAHEMLILSNLRLVSKIAFKYVWLNAMPLMDLIGEGAIGLGTAIRRFDKERYGKLSTYATWWIRSAITRAIRDRGRLIRIPAYMHEKVTRFYRMTNELANDLEREPTDDDIAAAFDDMDPDELAEMKRIHHLIPDSLNRLILDDDEELGNMIAGSTDEAANEQFARHDQLHQLLRDTHLSDTERRVLTLRYGLEDGRFRTLDDVGKDFGVTRERIRQIEARALKKIRRKAGIPDGNVQVVPEP